MCLTVLDAATLRAFLAYWMRRSKAVALFVSWKNARTVDAGRRQTPSATEAQMSALIRAVPPQNSGEETGPR